MLVLSALTPVLYDEGGVLRSFPEGIEFRRGYVRVADVVLLLPDGEPQGLLPTGGYVSRHTSGGSEVFPAYRQVGYADVWENVDLVFTPTEGGKVEFQVVVRPGGNPEDVEITFNRPLSVSEESIGVGNLSISNVKAYQGTDGVEVHPVVDGNTLRFDVRGYDPSRPLVIDPDLGSVPYARLFGGSRDEGMTHNSLAVGPDGSIYITGYTYSGDFDFGSASGYDTQGDTLWGDIFVLRLNSDLQILSATYVGDPGSEEMDCGFLFCYYPLIAVDSSGNVFLAFSDNDFAVPPGGYRDTSVQSDGVGVDVVILKLSSDLSTLLAGTYFGGRSTSNPYGGDEEPLKLEVTPSGNVVLMGITESDTLLDIVGGAISTPPSPDSANGFVAIFSNDLSSLLASTYFGTYRNDDANGMKFFGMTPDPSGNVFVAFTTAVNTLPVIGGRPFAGGFTDIYIAKFSPDLSTILASTYLGGSRTDGYTWNAHIPMATGQDGSLYLAFTTYSSDFPIVGGYDNTLNGGIDAFVAKLSPDLSTIQASTFFGGDSARWANCYYSGFNETPAKVLVDGSGFVYVGGGLCHIEDFPTTPSAYDGDWGGDQDGFVMKLYPNLDRIRASSYYAWPGHQEVADIGLLPDGRLVAYGFADTNAVFGFPWEGYSGSPYGGVDIFVAVFDNATGVEERPTTARSLVVPTEEGVSIRVARSGYVALEVYSASGRRVYERVLGYVPAGEYDVPLRELPRGAYMLKVRVGERVEKVKTIR